MSQKLGLIASFSEDLCQIPGTHMMELQPVILVLNEDYHLLISLSTRHSCGTQPYMQTNTLNTE